MPWPLSQDYNEAIQSPTSSFDDPELRAGRPVSGALGLPMPRSGNFADVYEFIGASGAKWAIKCFTRAVPGLRQRYSEISKHLIQARLPFTVDFDFLERGVRIRGDWYPVLKMQWVEGFLLNEFVRNNLDKPSQLEGLGQIWARMARCLRDANIAHADLQHGNVLLVPGRKVGSLAVKLIDYDGMWIPALASKKSGEVGHPAYQHPQRLREGTYSADVDRLPLLAIACALRALAVAGKPLWDRHDNGDNLLFHEADLGNPAASALFKELWQINDTAVHDLTGHLVIGLNGSIDQVRLLQDLRNGDRIRSPSVERAPEVSGILRHKADGHRQPSLATLVTPEAITTYPAPVLAESQPMAAHASPDWAQVASAQRKPVARKRANGGFVNLAIVAAVMLLALAVLGVAGLAGLLTFKLEQPRPELAKKDPPDSKDKNLQRDKMPLEIVRPSALGAQGAPIIVFLSDLNERDVRVESDWFRKNGTLIDGHKREFPVVVDGAKSSHALFTHPPSTSFASVSYDLDQPYTQFLAKVVIPNLVADQEDPASPIIFEVFGNGKSIWKSNPLAKRGDTQDCEIALVGINHLELRVHHSGRPQWAWAVWLEPRLIRNLPKNKSLPQADLPKFFTNSIGMKFVWIPPGSFMMGSPEDEKARRPEEIQHKVTLTKGFYMGIYPVTQEEWQLVARYSPSHFYGEKNLPVEMVSWEDCQEFITQLRDRDKKSYRLPTEAEWEYSCRAATTGPFHFGETIFTDQANYDGTFAYGAGKKGVLRQKTTPVSSFTTNAWGLHDMHGNVREWCQDKYGEYPRNAVVDPKGPDVGQERVLRGGSWISDPQYCRSAFRANNFPERRYNSYGFRVCFFVD